MENFLKIFEWLCVICWVVGFFYSADIRLILWSVPAGYGAGQIIGRMIIK